MNKKNTGTKRKVLIASDHAGFELKAILTAHIKSLGYDVEDMGAKTLDPEDDYPVILTPVAMRVATEPEKYTAIVLGGSGNGEAMLCNRFPSVRTAVYYGGGYIEKNDEVGAGKSENRSSLDIVRLAREHNDANILSLGARFVTDDEAKAAVEIFLETPFSGDERHARRIREIDTIE